MFWKKKSINSVEYETLLKRVIEIRHDIEDVKAALQGLETSYNDLRGKFNRKLYKMTPEEEKGTETKEKDLISQSLNTFNPFKL